MPRALVSSSFGKVSGVTCHRSGLVVSLAKACDSLICDRYGHQKVEFLSFFLVTLFLLILEHGHRNIGGAGKHKKSYRSLICTYVLVCHFGFSY